MSETSDNNLLAVWQRLMLQWQAADTAYRTAIFASKALESDADRDSERDVAEKRALAELQIIKQQIGDLISEGRRRHIFNPDSLVVGTVERTLHVRAFGRLRSGK